MDPMVGGRALAGATSSEGARPTMARNCHVAADWLEEIEGIDYDSPSTTAPLKLFPCFGNIGAKADPIVLELVDHFGRVGEVPAANPRLIDAIDGDQASFFLLKIAHVAVRTTAREPLEARPVLGSASALMSYLSVIMRDEANEATRLLFLHHKNALIKGRDPAPRHDRSYSRHARCYGILAGRYRT